MRRLFLGIELDSVARLAATEVLGQLEKEVRHQSLRYVRPEKLHLTLMFLGDVSDSDETLICDVVDQVASQAPAFDLKLRGLGGFPAMKWPRVLWLGVDGALESAHRVHEALAASLRGIVNLESKPFVPHITLGRVSPGSPAVGHMVCPIQQSVGDSVLAQWTVSEVVLFESHPDGRYVPVHRSAFKTYS
jgi:RNA 2',3'-cyclic 3'-phosphodiesterase